MSNINNDPSITNDENVKKAANHIDDFELVLFLNRTRHLIFKARQKELKNHGFPLRSSGALTAIVRLGKEATPTRIAREYFLEPHTVSETLSKLEKRGLVKKIRDLEKKNLIRLELTDKGYEMYEKSSLFTAYNDIMSALTGDEKLELWSLLSKIQNKTTEYLEIPNDNVYPPQAPQ